MPDLEFYTADDAEATMAGYEAAGLVPVTFGGATKSQSMTWREGTIEDILGGDARATASGVSVSLKSSMSVGALFACARVIAEDVAKLPLLLREYATDGKGRLVTKRVEEHHAVRLLREPNEYMTTQDFLEIMTAIAVMTGTAYALKSTVDGLVRELWPLLPGQCVQRDDLWQTRKELWFSIYHDDGSTDLVPASSVVRLREFGLDRFEGADIVRQAREAIGANMAIMRSQGKLFGANQRPSGVLTVEEPLDKRPAAQPPSQTLTNPHGGGNQNAVTIVQHHAAASPHDRIRQQWNKAYGSGGEGGVAVLDRGFKYQPIDVTNADADTLKVWEALVAEICRILRVSPVKVMQSAGSVSYNSLEQTNQNHLTDTLEPRLIRIEQAFARDLLTYDERHGVRGRRLAWYFDRNEILRPLPKDRFEIYAKARQMNLMTVNEIRDAEDMPRVEEPRADELFAPIATNPGGNPSTTAKPAATTPAPKPEPSADAQN